ncbi:HNH endonuclease [Candidatus Thiosymbion oneisti]|uniref:HNH endonuclease n=1 Tax=Candidatus Thiosymbion oneisti TaxID=589554 RepID=UPI00105DFEDE|nr:HNH endonuclease domain-containing protein [Candidatus Thiosymbion oneisti]
MNRGKRRFSYPERYAIWHCNGRRCWWCREPLRLVEVTIDHVLPESLLDDEEKRKEILAEYGLPQDFNINGYENWLPCHNHCNQSKGNKIPVFVPGNKAIIDALRDTAPKAERTARAVSSNAAKDNVFKTVFTALEKQTITVRDLDELLQAFVDDPAIVGVPSDVIILDSGYWVPREQIAREGTCRCERNACVGRDDKVYCYFEASLSPWVINTGLFWRCYDEVISCPRCSRQHKRGHIGRKDVCGRPYNNQETLSD